jgi:4-amino-4-deoxy-L-arabinose transferase-like glycosyltransferase
MINFVRGRVKPGFVARFLAAVTVALVGFDFALLLTKVVRTVMTTRIPFDVDEANHATDGWEVYQALISQGPQELYHALVEQSFYPPVHSFFVAAGYALGGPTLAASRLPTLVNLVLTTILLVWLTLLLASGSADRQTNRWLLVTGGALTLAFALTSKVFVINGALVMVEMTGALLGLLLIAACVRVGERTQAWSGWGALVCAVGVAGLTFLTKYSFGLFFLPALLVGLVTATWPWRAKRRTWLAVAVVSAIYLVWLTTWWLVSDPTGILLFFTDHPQYNPLFSRANLFYQARIWFTGYSASWTVASLTVVLAVVGAVRGWRVLAVRVAAWSILAGLVVLTISTTDEPRHFLPLAPLVWLLAGLGLAAALHWLWRQRWGEPLTVVVVVTLLVLLGVGAKRMAASLPAQLRTSFEGVPAHSHLHGFALSHVDLSQPVLIIGDLYDQNNLLSIRWQAATLTSQGTWALDIDYFPFEQYEHSLARTNRKPQIASIDPTFPRLHLNEILDRHHFAAVIEIKDLKNYFGPRATNPDDPLCRYPVQEMALDGWIIMVYDLQQARPDGCG